MSKIMKIFQGASIAAVSLAFSTAAFAAECFDRETDDPKAGDTTAVVGPSVGLLRSSAADFTRPDAGDDVFTGDRVRTGEASHLQLKLCDWSTYTFSPESESDIAEFFDAQGAGRRRVVNFIRGGFRFASGRDTEPGSTEVEIQESGVTMGVRGTNVILVELDGYVYALLEGPALDNSGLTPKGAVEFWQGNRDQIIARLKKPGYVVRIGPDGVSEPFRADAELLRRIYEAFVPVIPDDDGSPTDYAGDPLQNSGQGEQEGDEYQDFASREGEQDDENTENYPEDPFRTGFNLNVGDILPLDALEEFAIAQANPDGHVFALASAQLFLDTGGGPTLADEGVALIQLHLDWATRTLAPEALASFVKLDFSVSDPTDLTILDFDQVIPNEVNDQYLAAVLASANVPFQSGENSFAVFPAQLFTFTVRQGAGATATADVDVDISATDNQNVVFNAVATFTDLQIMPGEGELAFFEFDLGFALSIAQLEGFATSGTAVMTGFSDTAVSTLGTPAILPGASYARLVVDYDNRTVGGSGSFLAISAANGGVNTLAFLPINQTTPFSSGLFNLALFPLSLITSDPALEKGQAIISTAEGNISSDIAAILNADDGSHLFTEIELSELFGPSALPLATIAGLEAQVGSQGSGTFHFDATFAGRGFPGFAEIELADGNEFFGNSQVSIDINFANRTIGGGGSFIGVNINDTGFGVNINFMENLAAISFDDAASGAGVFGFDGGDFSGSNIESALFLIRDGPQFGDGEVADIFFNFTDGAGGRGFGGAENMPIVPGATSQP